MQFELTALSQRRFKKPVEIKVALNEVDSKGDTKYGKSLFIAHFVEQGENAGKDMQEAIERMQSDVNRLKSKAEDEPSEENINAHKDVEKHTLEEMKALIKDNLSRQFVGFEKHPKHDMPFLDGGQELTSSPENIRKLIDIKIVSDAVTKAYVDEINPGLRKLIEGNSKK
jgi:hypothetical protein